MNEAAIHKHIAELNHMLIDAQPSNTSSDDLGLAEPHCQAAETTVAECLAQVRLKLKYVLFDLEATRRENRYLRQMLEVHRRRRYSSRGGSEPDFDGDDQDDT